MKQLSLFLSSLLVSGAALAGAADVFEDDVIDHLAGEELKQGCLVLRAVVGGDAVIVDGDGPVFPRVDGGGDHCPPILWNGSSMSRESLRFSG